MEKLRQLTATAQSTASGKSQVSIGNYVGNGKYGNSNQNQLSLPFLPKLLLVHKNSFFICRDGGGWQLSFLWCNGLTTRYSIGQTIYFTVSGNSISWYSGSSSAQQNDSGVRYYYTAIG